jgi:hemerythrin-like domain-containing protein
MIQIKRTPQATDKPGGETAHCRFQILTVPAVRPLAYTIIAAEHAALAAVVRTLVEQLNEIEHHGKAPDFALLRAMLFYIDEFPERLHHTKESGLLFPLLRQRAPELNAVLDQLDREHDLGEGAIRDLTRVVLAYEMMGDERRAGFLNAARRYAHFYLAHMRLEEEAVMPVALNYLTPADWAQLNQAFADNRDPLAGHTGLQDYRPLFTHILSAVMPLPALQH